MIARSAVISPDELYRYLLVRKWGMGGKRLIVVGLNPSTADAITDDATIKLLTRMAIRYGFSELRMLNLFAFRATEPKVMRAAENPVGPKNEEYLEREMSNLNGNDRVLLMWGAHGNHRNEANRVMEKLRVNPEVFSRVMTIGLTATGQPRHVLYTRSTVVMHPVSLYQTENTERLANFNRGVTAMGSLNYFPQSRPVGGDYYWSSGKRDKTRRHCVTRRIYDQLTGEKAVVDGGLTVKLYPEAWLAVEDLGRAILNRNRRTSGLQ